MEIERKFVIADGPDLSPSSSVEIEQGYLSFGDDTGAEVRLRRRGGERTLTVKGGTGRSRIEEEIALDRRRFESLWPLTEGRRVQKTRHLFPSGEVEIELDVYRDELEGLRIAEVEFPSEAAADAFTAPDWFGDEVTGNVDYLNRTLATKGLPPGHPS